MDTQEIGTLIEQTALLMERHRRLCEALEQRQIEHHDALTSVLTALPAQITGATDAARATLERETGNTVRHALQGAFQDHATQINHAARKLQQDSDALAHRLHKLETASRGLLWKSSAVAVASLAVLLGAALWLGTHYREQIARYQIEAELLQAYNRADVRLCGDAELCANVEQEGPRYGKDKRYQRVRPRP